MWDLLELRPCAPTARGNEGTLLAPQQGDSRGLANSSAQWSGEIQKAGLSTQRSLPALILLPYLASGKQVGGALNKAAVGYQGQAPICHSQKCGDQVIPGGGCSLLLLSLLEDLEKPRRVCLGNAHSMLLLQLGLQEASLVCEQL